jgi:hypothetical protein
MDRTTADMDLKSRTPDDLHALWSHTLTGGFGIQPYGFNSLNRECMLKGLTAIGPGGQGSLQIVGLVSLTHKKAKDCPTGTGRHALRSTVPSQSLSAWQHPVEPFFQTISAI